MGPCSRSPPYGALDRHRLAALPITYCIPVMMEHCGDGTVHDSSVTGCCTWVAQRRMKAMQRELELKVELSPAEIVQLEVAAPSAGLGIGPAQHKELRSVYFDTPDHDLHAAGISLRLRRQNGGW